jgi:outer membrane protein
MRPQKILLPLLGLLLIGGSLEWTLASNIKIGFVDIQRAVNECQAGKEAKKAIAKELEKYNRQFLEKQKELQAMRESLEKQAPMLNPDVRANKEKELQNKIREFQRWQEDVQNEVNQKTKEMERTISLGLQKVIQKLGEEEGYSLILDKNEMIVLFASKAIDLTDRVIKLHDMQKK